ncbi:MAG TPA: TfoX/Sxy family DNA transformation protein [Methylophilaceae bacterium]|nr:TfoX/Sxy family DNA transformation protein [Methylophilaceae bacterium]
MQCPGCGRVHAQPQADLPVTALPDLGAVAIGWLQQVGIENLGELAALGAAAAYLRVEALGVAPDINLLYALEGAVSGAHWLEVKRESKAALLQALEAARTGVPA